MLGVLPSIGWHELQEDRHGRGRFFYCLSEDIPFHKQSLKSSYNFFKIASFFYAIIHNMSKKPLIETNPYLRDPEKYWKSLITNVASSTAIETETSTQSIEKLLAGSGYHLKIPFSNIKEDTSK